MKTEVQTIPYNDKNTCKIQNKLESQKRKCIKDMYIIAIMHTHLILADIDELLEQSNENLMDKKVSGFKYQIEAVVDASIEFYRSILQRV